MRLALVSALVASLALGAEPGEAAAVPPIMRFKKPFTVRGVDFPDGGFVLAPETFDKTNQEFIRLQNVEQDHKAEVGPAGWFVAGTIAGAIVGLGVAGLVWVVTK